MPMERTSPGNVMLWVTDENHKCKFLTQTWTEFTGQTEGEGCERGWTSAVYPDDRERCRQFYKHLLSLADGECDSIDHRVVRTDGTLRWVRLHATPVDTGPSDQRTCTQLIGTAIDITQQREFEQSREVARGHAIAANDSKSEFLAYMSHEIRSPMTAILGYAELLREHVDNEQAVGHLNTIRRNGGYLLEIINDVLDLSKIEAGKFELDRERFDPSQVVEDVRSIMDVRASEKDLQLEVHYEGKIPSLIQSDPQRLKQVLINLVGNAIKFTNQGSVKLIIDYKIDNTKPKRDERGVLRFRVVDSGIGMSDEQRTKLFKPFVQADSSVSHRFGGTGLGLVISQRLAKMLGSNIEIESELGKGSTFTFAIATGDVPEAAMVDPGSADEPQSTDAAVIEMDSLIDCHILVVDDRRDIRFLSKHILTKAGASVDECEDGQLAVDYVRSAMNQANAPDLILLDMQMPKLDGYQTARVLRSLGYAGPIIALTGDAMQGDASKCVDAGCNHYLSKPINAAHLLAMVAEMIEQVRAVGSGEALSLEVKFPVGVGP